ncbi:MAG TPA: 8-amino-7-oxononanoate synthase [Kofleriaceae bacterium]|nr:8-amino-7-oxononanoate synthase [Kofleriaceae bacterium]
MSQEDRDREWREDLTNLSARGLRRKLRLVVGAQGRLVELDGQARVNFSSNNYLGLSAHRELAARAAQASREVGCGATASRLIVGNMAEHELLEHELAAFHGTAAALLLNTGYSANIGILQAICGPEDEVFSDALNHASIIDGCRLSRARITVVPHLDLAALERGLKTSTARRKLVVTDSVFSMDGDRADVAGLARLAAEHGAALMLDEAHAIGVVGPRGRGLAAEVGVRADIHLGTLGKAFGSFGAYVAGSRALVELLLNRARSFVFTTGLPPGVVAASRAALEIVAGPEGEDLRRRLRLRVEELTQGLRRLGLPASAASPIFPIIVGDEGRTMECCEALLALGVYAQGIRPPTVPRGTSRLRIALMATHTPEDVRTLLGAIRGLIDRGLLPAGDPAQVSS